MSASLWNKHPLDPSQVLIRLRKVIIRQTPSCRGSLRRRNKNEEVQLKAVNSVLKSECQWAVNKVSYGGAPELLKPILYNFLRPHHSHTLSVNLPAWSVRFLPPHPAWKLNTRLSWFQRHTLAFWLQSSLMFDFMLLTFFTVRRQGSKWLAVSLFLHHPLTSICGTLVGGCPRSRAPPPETTPHCSARGTLYTPVPVGCQTWDHSPG